jgi:hypothetical protein
MPLKVAIDGDRSRMHHPALPITAPGSLVGRERVSSMYCTAKGRKS